MIGWDEWLTLCVGSLCAVACVRHLTFRRVWELADYVEAWLMFFVGAATLAHAFSVGGW